MMNKWLWGLVIFALMLVVLTIIALLQRADILSSLFFPESFQKTWFDFQTLIAGILALIAGSFALFATYQQIHASRDIEKEKIRIRRNILARQICIKIRKISSDLYIAEMLMEKPERFFSDQIPGQKIIIDTALEMIKTEIIEMEKIEEISGEFPMPIMIAIMRSSEGITHCLRSVRLNGLSVQERAKYCNNGQELAFHLLHEFERLLPEEEILFKAKGKPFQKLSEEDKEQLWGLPREFWRAPLSDI